MTRAVFLAAALMLVACGPTASTDGSGSGNGSATDDGVASSGSDGPGQSGGLDGGPSDDTAGSTGAPPCPEGEYCFEIVDLEIDGGGFVVGDIDGDGRAEVSFGSAGNQWLLDWEDEGLVLLGPVEASAGGASFFAPSPVDGVPQFFAFDGAYALEGGTLVEREHPRPALVGMPPMKAVGMTTGTLGPLDFDGDGRHDLLVYETFTDYLAHTGHLVRFENGTPTVVGPPLPARVWTGHLASGSLHMAAADFDGDGRDELVVPDDVITPVVDIEPYDPANHQLVTLRVTEDGYEELWRAPAALYAVELILSDLDGDGALDLVVAGRLGLAMARGLGGGVFEDPSVLDLSPYAPELETHDSGVNGVQDVATADLDGDGLLEIVMLLKPSQDLVVVEDPLGAADLGVLLEAFGGGSSYVSGSSAFLVGDFDANGCDDVVVRTADEPHVARVLMFHR